MNRLIWTVSYVLFFVQGTAAAACLLPNELATSTWIDSDKGSLAFNSTHMSGFDFTFNGQTYQNWECYHTVGGVDGTLILKGTESFQYVTGLADLYQPYLCMDLTTITDFSIKYYLLWAEQHNLGYGRITMIVSTATISDPVNQLCWNTSSLLYPSVNEYHVMVKEGHESDAKQLCDSDFYGVYSYTVTDLSAGNTFCGSGDERWDVCTDKRHMTFNYTICGEKIAYSADGSVFCVAVIRSGSYVLQTVYNEDATVDASAGTHRFTCLMSSISSDGSLTVSQAPGSCTKTQTPSTQPTLTDGTVVGLNLQLSPIPGGLCPDVTDDDDSSIGAIVGGVVGGFLTLVAIATAVVLLLYCKCRGRRREKDEQKSLTPSKESGPSLHSESVLRRSLSAVEEDIEDSEKTNEGYGNENEDFSIKKGKESVDYEFTDITKPENSTDAVEAIIEINNEQEDSVSEEIEVTRIVQSTEALTKVGQHLNSTENLFSDYDPAMTYTTRGTGILKIDESVWRLDAKQIGTNPENVGVRAFEFTRDDSGIDIFSESKPKAEQYALKRRNKSEGNILETLKKIDRSDTRATLQSNSIEWNFVYTSPYAMTQEQKQAALERKIKTRKRRRRMEKKKREERDQRERENIIAFERWKENKRLQRIELAEKQETASSKERFYKYKAWIPT